MSFQITVARGRSVDYSGVLYESDESTAVTPASGSKVRFKAGRRNGATPALDIDSVAATANGSVMTLDVDTGAYTLKIDQNDTRDLVPGVYEAEIALVDVGDGNRIKTAEFGTLQILESLDGDLSIT